MSFWDTYVDTGGGVFVSAEEKASLIDNGVVFGITEIVEEKGGKYGDRFITTVLLPNPLTGENEERKLGFGKGTVQSRDRMLEAMSEYFEGEGEGESLDVTLEKIGQAILIRKAE